MLVYKKVYSRESDDSLLFSIMHTGRVYTRIRKAPSALATRWTCEPPFRFQARGRDPLWLFGHKEGAYAGFLHLEE